MYVTESVRILRHILAYNIDVNAYNAPYFGTETIRARRDTVEMAHDMRTKCGDWHRHKRYVYLLREIREDSFYGKRIEAQAAKHGVDISRERIARFGKDSVA